VKPSEVPIDAMGCITDTLGRVEHEFVAALIVRWHQLHSPDEWKSISREDVATLFGTDTATADEQVATGSSGVCARRVHHRMG
jgi:hypothetical protein